MWMSLSCKWKGKNYGRIMVYQPQMPNKYLLNLLNWWYVSVCICVLGMKGWGEVNVSFFISLFWSNGSKGDINPLRDIVCIGQDFLFLFTVKLFCFFLHWFMIALIWRTYSKSMITVFKVEVDVKVLPSAWHVHVSIGMLSGTLWI